MLSRKYLNSTLCFAIIFFRFFVSGRKTLTAKSNAVTYVESRDLVLSGSGTRWRRSVMSQQEIDGSLAIHNSLRRLEGASDMEFMKWNSYLASMAQQWADGCNFVHGQPSRDPSILPYENIGQNLYATTARLNVTGAIKSSWYDEKQYFDYDSLRCTPGKQCGHYTQVVWASSREIGCAYRLCSNLRSSGLGKATYLVCNYGPAGNYVGQKPYKKGKACSRCGNEANWCNDKLCNSGCRKPGPGCVCAATCLNCGVLNKASCTCSCTPGWHGNDCSAVCRNTDKKCNNGWPPSFCNLPDYGATVRRNCPLMCKLCRVANGTEPTCLSSSADQSNDATSRSFAFVTMTFVMITSFSRWTIDLPR